MTEHSYENEEGGDKFWMRLGIRGPLLPFTWHWPDMDVTEMGGEGGFGTIMAGVVEFCLVKETQRCSEEDKLRNQNGLVSDKETYKCSTNYQCSRGGNYCSTKEYEAINRRSIDVEPEIYSDRYKASYR